MTLWKTYKLLLFFTACMATSGCAEDPVAESTTPAVTLNSPENLKRTSVTVSATISSAIDTGIVNCLFYFNPESSETHTENIRFVKGVVSPSDANTFVADVSGLEIGTVYFYSAVFQMGAQQIESEVKSFVTTEKSAAYISDIKQSGKTLSATIVDDGGSAIQNVGFCWGTDNTPDILSNSILAKKNEDNSFSARIPELDAQKTYYFYAFADNGDGTVQRIAYSNNPLSIFLEEKEDIVLEGDIYIAPYDGGILQIPFQTNVEYSVSSSDNWISIVSTKNLEAQSITLDIAKNPEDKIRESEITISSKDADILRKIVIRQGRMPLEFKDREFASYLVRNFDSDEDGVISIDEVPSISAINVRTDNIRSLEGIEQCQNLRVLRCNGSTSNGMLSSLDISANSRLEILDCSNNCLTELNIRDNAILRELNCSNNQIHQLSLESNEYLVSLICNDNRLTDLNIAANRNLKTLYCQNNDIEEIIIWDGFETSRQSDIIKDDKAVYVSGNSPITIPDPVFKTYLIENYDGNGDGEISRNEALSVTSITVYTENITSLQGLEYFLNLIDLSCKIHYDSWRPSTGEMWDNDIPVNHSKLSELDISKNTNLENLSCEGNSITELNVSGNLKLQYLECFSNELESLDIENNLSLKGLSCSGNHISTLNVNNNAVLTRIECGGNQLISLDVSQNTALTYLDCSNNQLQSLDVSNNKALVWLDCYGNQIKVLDVSQNTALTSLKCDYNQLSMLDASKNASLTSLNCGYNQISMLDVSKNASLGSLYCYNNQLSTLDVSNNTALTSLSCGSNQLSTLDVSENIILTSLYCNNNQLSTLDVSNNLSLTYLNCWSNPSLTELWMASNQQIENLSYDSSVTTIKYK